MLLLGLIAASTLCSSTVATTNNNFNKFGIGVYGGSYVGLTVAPQLPWARNLTGRGGRVLLYVGMSFAENGNVSSCTAGCVPSAEDAAAVNQAYAMGLRPVVRLGQWPRTIRDFSDDADHLVYASLARAYRSFAAALPLPPDGTSALEIQVLNEINTDVEWKCSGEGRISTNDTAAEVAGCVRDILVALRPLPRLLLSVFPTAYTGPATYPCVANVNGTHDHVNFTKATDIAFMAKMLHAVPDLYTHADFFNSHPYPFHHEPFSSPLGRAGVVHYRAQLNASGRPTLPVLITETGWREMSGAALAKSVVAALTEEWLPDARVASVMPFLLSAGGASRFAQQSQPWVVWPNATAAAAAPVATLQYNATRALRCRLGVGGSC